MSATDRIEANPKGMMGKPVIRGARIPREDIRAALGYAADAVAHEETLILPTAGSGQSA